MSNKRDMRRADLVVPYTEGKEEEDKDAMSSMTSMMPMVAMFTRNRMIAWGSVLMSVQNWLAETPDTRKKASTPAYLAILMSLSAAAVTYLPLFLPPQPNKAAM